MTLLLIYFMKQWLEKLKTLQMNLPYHDKGRFLTELMMVLPITNLVHLRTTFGNNILRYWIYCAVR